MKDPRGVLDFAMDRRDSSSVEIVVPKFPKSKVPSRTSPDGSLQRAVPGVMFVVVVTLVLLIAPPAFAEVMDKEPTSGVILLSLLVHVAIAVVAALAQRWLLLLSFLAFVPTSAVFAWTECHNEFVGPAILQEAGQGYCTLAGLAVAAMAVVHTVLWFAVSRLKRYDAATHPSLWASPRTLGFVVLLFGVLLLATNSGFSGTEDRIYWSMPILVQGAFVAATVVMFFRSRFLGASSQVSSGPGEM